MPWDDADDDADDDGRFVPPLPPEDRLWRHPSEVAAGGLTTSGTRSRSTPIWGIAAVAGLLGAVLTMGVITLIGGLEPRVVERQVVERVAIPPVVSSVSSDDAGVVAVAEDLRPAIVRLEVERPDGPASGSGVVFRDNGYLLTNAHVVDGATSVTAEFADGSRRPADVLGADLLTDIAVLKVEGENFATAVLGTATELRVGEPAIAIGSPAGLAGGPSVTTGVISAVGRRVVQPDGESLHDMIQTDAPIAPGSSGGALVDSRGAVIGITTAIAVTEVGSEGLGFATPIDIARAVADDIIVSGEARHPLLGIEGRDLDMGTAAGLGLSGGALVVDVTDGGPAEAAGLQAGDVIVGVGSRETESMSELVVVVRDHEPGETVEVSYLRDDEPRTAEVTLSER